MAPDLHINRNVTLHKDSPSHNFTRLTFQEEFQGRYLFLTLGASNTLDSLWSVAILKNDR